MCFYSFSSAYIDLRIRLIIFIDKWQKHVTCALKTTNCDIYRLVVDIKKDVGPSHRQDYALFVRFDSVGSKDAFLRDDNSNTMKSKYEMNKTIKYVVVKIH